MSEEGFRKSTASLKDEVEVLKTLLKEVRAMVESASGVREQATEIARQAQAAQSGLETTASNYAVQLSSVNELLTKSKDVADKIEVLHGDALSCNKEIASISGSATRIAGDIEEGERQYKVLLANIKYHTEILDNLKTEHERVFTNESSDRETIFKATHSKIERLLAGATSAGLATAFEERREKYEKPRKAWAIAGVVAIFLIVEIALLYSGNVLEVSGWRELLLVFAKKIPVMGPLVFVAYYSFHQYGILSRIEEEYAHKAALSIAFEGYKTQLLALHDDQGNPTPTLEKLIGNTLDAIKQLSAEAYDSKTRPVTPIEGASGKIIDLAAKLVDSAAKGESGSSPLTGKWAIVGSSAITALMLIVGWLVIKAVGH